MSGIGSLFGVGFPTQDYVIIGSDKSPGKATIHGANSPRGWDIRKGYALSGATVVPTGDELAEHIILTIEIWDDTDVGPYYAFAKKYFAKDVRFAPGSLTPKPLTIFHPQLAAPPISITQVVVKDVTQLDRDEYGLWFAHHLLLQYRKPKPALPKPSGLIPGVSDAAPTALDAADLEIQSKIARFKQLAGGG